MNTLTLLVMAVAILPAFGLATGAWLSAASANEELRSFAAFKSGHFED